MGRVIWAGGTAAVLAGLVAACAPEVRVETGRALYGDYCAACHGDSGRGDGIAAPGLSVPPSDLTGLSAANGGVFPLVGVMGKVYGYSQGKGGGGGPMPEFGPLMEGRTVLVETGPGIFTPTPERLVLLAEYVEGMQAE
ncbi:MAG: cytochrome c [Gemmobacter sp.]